MEGEKPAYDTIGSPEEIEAARQRYRDAKAAGHSLKRRRQLAIAIGALCRRRDQPDRTAARERRELPAMAQRALARESARARAEVKEQAKMFRMKAAEARFAEFLAGGHAYRLLTKATQFMTDEGFEVLRHMALGGPCKCGHADCERREPDIRAHQLLARMMEVCAQGELVILAAKKQKGGQAGSVTVEDPGWAQEGSKL